MEKAEREKRLTSEPRQVAETSARRAAKLLRRRLGNDFAAFAEDIKAIDPKLFRIEVARVLPDERDEALHREREARRATLMAAAAELPAPEDDTEAAILAKHGFA